MEAKSIWQENATSQRRMIHQSKDLQKAIKAKMEEKENPQNDNPQTQERENHKSTKLRQKLQAKRKENSRSRTQMQQNQKMSLESNWKNSKRR